MCLLANSTVFLLFAAIGESGAGKTEASNILVQQFMRLGRAETKVLEEKILKVSYIHSRQHGYTCTIHQMKGTLDETQYIV